MVILILDLDLTSIATESDSKHLNPIHTRSNHGLSYTFNLVTGSQTVAFEIINPIELSRLIETACQQYDGVMILTSGYWTRTIIGKISDYLDLSDDAAKKFVCSALHSSLTDYRYFLSDKVENIDRVRFTKTLSKKIRLEKIIEANPKLKDAYFVFVDDNTQHINELKNHPRVTPILATAYTADKTFYAKAHEALAEAYKKEQQLKEQQLEESKKVLSKAPLYTLFGEDTAALLDTSNAATWLQTPSNSI